MKEFFNDTVWLGEKDENAYVGSELTIKLIKSDDGDIFLNLAMSDCRRSGDKWFSIRDTTEDFTVDPKQLKEFGNVLLSAAEVAKKKTKKSRK